MSQDSRLENARTLVPKERTARRRHLGYFVGDQAINLPPVQRIEPAQGVEYAEIVTDPDLPTFG